MTIDRTKPTAIRPIAEWNDFAEAIGPHLTADNPLASLAASGVQLAGQVEAAFKDAPPHPVGEALMASLRQEYGVVPARLRIGRTRVEPPPVRTTGFALVATADLAVANDVLAELYRVGVIAHELTTSETGQLVSVDLLRETCIGVPEDAELGQLRIPYAPSVAASSIVQRNLRLDARFELPLLGSQPVELSGVLHLEVPLEFKVSEAHVTPFSSAITTGTLEIGAASPVRPASEEARQRLEAELVRQVAAAVTVLVVRPDYPLRFRVSIPVHKSRFPNSTIDLAQLAAVAIRQAGRDYLVAGLNIEQAREIDPIKLIGQLAPASPENIRTVVDEEFASDALSAVISSRDLTRFVNRVIARHSHGAQVPDMVVKGGRIIFTDGRLEVTLDCVWSDICMGLDVAFTASLSGWPAVDRGKLTISGSEIDFDLDDIDAVVCVLVTAQLGPASLAFYAGVLAILAAYNPNSSELDIPVSETSEPLPRSDKVIDLKLKSALMETDVLTGEGTLALITDPKRIYAYLRILERQPTGDPLPLTDAQVTLWELDYPPPVGDDVGDPSGYTETVTRTVEITDEVIYNPKADEELGTATTDKNGRVTFAVLSDMLGGSATHTTVTHNLHTGRESVTITNELVGEAMPDLAVSIRAADGVLVADKRLIELNVENRRLGRFDQPVDVLVEPHDPPPPMTTVPDVLQLGKKSAVAIIVAAGLTAEAHGPDRPSAWVRSQHPAGDTVVPLGSNVTLTLTTETRQ